MEFDKTIKMVYKFTDKVMHLLYPEKTKVKLVDAAFHESTIKAKNGHPEFADTAEFFKIYPKIYT